MYEGISDSKISQVFLKLLIAWRNMKIFKWYKIKPYTSQASYVEIAILIYFMNNISCIWVVQDRKIDINTSTQFYYKFNTKNIVLLTIAFFRCFIILTDESS